MAEMEIEQAAIALFSFVVVVSALGFVFDYQDVVRNKFRQETTDLVAERVAGDIQALSSFENGGQIEINLAADKYRVDATEFREQGDYIYQVNVTFDGKSASYSNVSLNQEMVWNKGEGQYICLRKNTEFRAEVGEC